MSQSFFYQMRLVGHSDHGETERFQQSSHLFLNRQQPAHVEHMFHSGVYLMENHIQHM